MADNITINTLTGSPVCKTDDDGTAHWPYTKIAFGADDTRTRVATGVAGLPVSSEVNTSGGTLFYYDNDLDETKVEVKSSSGKIYWIHVMNLRASKLYLQIFNKTSAGVTVGTTIPDMQFVLPTQGDTNGAGFTLSVSSGISMGTGIVVACTTDSEGNSATSTNDCSINVGYA